MSAISVENLEFCYPGDRGFCLSVNQLDIPGGSSVAIVGPSGSGKSTLLNLLAGNLVPQAGTIRIGETGLQSLTESALRQFRIDRVGQVFQAFELLQYLSVLENVMLPRTIEGLNDEQVTARAEQLLVSMGLEEKQKDKPSRLSHGEQQRVAVCRAMLNRPELILADEPTGNLDQDNKQNVVDLLLSQARENDSTLLMVTHDQGLLDGFDQVIDFGALSGQSS